jgi:hypothetical protein
VSIDQAQGKLANSISEYNGFILILDEANMENMNTLKKAGTPVQTESATNQLVPVAPEASGTVSKKRKRLAKAFSRPLDKTLRTNQLVREKFSMPEGEFAKLLDLKQRLAEQGVVVKKSDLVRAGLMLLAALEDDDLKGVVETVPSVG